MKKQYISPELEVFDIDVENVMGNNFSRPETDKVEDDPTKPETPDVDQKDTDDDDDAIVNSKPGFDWGWGRW